MTNFTKQPAPSSWTVTVSVPVYCKPFTHSFFAFKKCFHFFCLIIYFVLNRCGAAVNAVKPLLLFCHVASSWTLCQSLFTVNPSPIPCFHLRNAFSSFVRSFCSLLFSTGVVQLWMQSNHFWRLNEMNLHADVTNWHWKYLMQKVGDMF